MGKRQNKLILLKGILAACLLFNHLGGYATIVSAMLPDNSSAELELSSQDQHDNQENSLDNNQAMLDPSQESDSNDKTMNFERRFCAIYIKFDFFVRPFEKYNYTNNLNIFQRQFLLYFDIPPENTQ